MTTVLDSTSLEEQLTTLKAEFAKEKAARIAAETNAKRAERKWEVVHQEYVVLTYVVEQNRKHFQMVLTEQQTKLVNHIDAFAQAKDAAKVREDLLQQTIDGLRTQLESEELEVCKVRAESRESYRRDARRRRYRKQLYKLFIGNFLQKVKNFFNRTSAKDQMHKVVQ